MKMPGARAAVLSKRTPDVNGDMHPNPAEAAWYNGLIVLERAGVIRDLKLAPSFRIDGHRTGKWVCNVKADAGYFDTRDSAHHVVDYKGWKGDTALSALKRRLVLEHHGVEIELQGEYVKRKAKAKAKRATARAWEKRAAISKPRQVTKR